MLINFFTLILLVIILIYVPVNSENNIRNYFIRTHFLADYKKREYDIFDQSENNIQYFIEARRTFGENIQIVASPSKQVVGKLKRDYFSFWYKYKATISVLDPHSNRWIEGKIKQNTKLIGTKYTIEWNGERISMTTKFATMSIEFWDEKNKTRLAQLQKRLSSIILTNRYDLTVFSNKIPDAIYFLTVAVHDYNVSKEESKEEE
jgi:hypothetical protein